MKKIFLIIILILIAGNIDADDFSRLKFKDINSAKLSISKIGKINCDMCGCYLGIDPNYNFSTAGFRYRYRSFDGTHHHSEEANVDHEDTSGGKEKYNTYELWGRYYINPKLQVTASLPVGSNDIGGETFSGMGDLLIMGQYQVLNTTVSGDTRFRNRLFLGGGVKFPTGKYNIKASDGDVEPHFQPGTGSFDFLLSGTYLAKVQKVGLSTDVVYKINTKNGNEYKFGNQFNANASLFYEIDAGNVVILPNAGIYFEQAPKDEANGVPDENSGGNVLFGNFGIDLAINKVTIKFSYQPPFSQKLFGDQPENDFRIITGIGYSFF